MKKIIKKQLAPLTFFIAFPFFTFAQNTGVGTTDPKAKLEVAASSSDTIPFKVSVNNQNKAKVYQNGGMSLGGETPPPVNGLAVAGVIQPNDSIKNSARPIYITSVQDSVVLQAGSTTIILSANGAVKIKASAAGGISLDGGVGGISITGNTVSIRATGGTATFRGINTVVQGDVILQAQSSLVQIGGISGSNYKPAARVGDQVIGNGVAGTIVTGSPTVMIQ